MNKRIALITGGTSGVGLSLVKALLENSYKVYFMGSNKEKGEKLELELNPFYKNSEAKFVHLDLSNLKKVKEFIEEFKQQNTTLDLLANIAGVVLPKRQETVDGIEKTLAVNYLSAFYLTTSLLPLLEKAAPSRIINVAGGFSLIKKEKLNFDDLNYKKRYNGFKAAILGVHAKAVFTQELSERLSKKNITVNAFHPGTVKSDLSRKFPWILRIIMKFMNFFFSSKSVTGIYLCLSDEVKNISGKLFIGKKMIELNYNKKYRRKLWEVSDEMIEKSLQ